MINDVLFRIGSTDYRALLSTYRVTYEVEFASTITAINGTEYGKPKFRPIITFSLIPLTDAQSAALFNAVKGSSVSVQYTDPNFNATRTASMKIASNLDSAFGLRSVDGNRYYKGGEIVLRQRTVI